MAEMPKINRRHSSMSVMGVGSMPMVPRMVDQRATAEGLNVPYRIGSEAYGRVARVASEINDARAQADGAAAGSHQAVSRDEDGNITVSFLPSGTIVNEAYNKAALETYHSTFKQSARAKAAELHREHRRDPAGFRASWDAWQEAAQSAMDPRVRAASTVVLAELGEQHHASLLEAAYTEQRQQQNGRIRNEISALSKDAIDLLSSGAAPSGGDVLSSLERVEVAWASLIKSGLATELEHGEFMRKFKPEMLKAFTLGKAGFLMGDSTMNDVLSFSRRVSEVREEIVAGTTGLDEIDNASQADRMSAADAFQQRQLSQLAVNKHREQKAKAQVAIQQADLMAKMSALAGTAEFDQLMEQIRPRDDGALLGLPQEGTATPATFAALRRLQVNEDLFQKIQEGKLEREKLYSHYQTKMIACGLSDDVHSCTAEVYQDAQALIQEDPDGRIIDGSKLTPTQALNLFSRHVTMMASENAKNANVEAAYKAITRAGQQSPSGALPNSQWKNLNTIEEHNPELFDLSQALTVSDEPGNEGAPLIDWNVATRIIAQAGIREMLSQGQIDFMNAARTSGDGRMLMLGARLFNAFTEIDGGRDATDKLDNYLSRQNKNGFLKGDFYFWEGMAAKLRASGVTDQKGIMKVAEESAREMNERMSASGRDKAQIILDNLYPETGKAGFEADVTAEVRNQLNERVEGRSGTGFIWNEIFGNRGHSLHANQIVGYDRDPGFIAASIASEDSLDTGWFGEDQTNMFSLEALNMISKAANRDVLLAQGQAAPVARTALRELNNARAAITPFGGEGRLVTWEIGRVAYEAARANGIVDLSSADARLGAMLQIKEAGARMAPTPNGFMEVLFGADVEENRLSVAIENGLVSLEPKFGDNGMYWEVRAKQPSGEFAYVMDDDGNRLRVHGSPVWRNDDGSVGLNKVYYMRKAFNDELMQGNFLEKSETYQAWAQWHLTEGIEWVLDEGSEVRNILRRSLGSPNGWASSSGADYFDDEGDMKTARELLQKIGTRYDRYLEEARAMLNGN